MNPEQFSAEWLRKYFNNHYPQVRVTGPATDATLTGVGLQHSSHVHAAPSRTEMVWGSSARPSFQQIHPRSSHASGIAMDFSTPNLQNKEHTMDRTEVITAELARLQDELAQRSVYGEDDHAEGAVLKFKVTYDVNSGKSYTYAAIKAGGRWHVTGSRSASNQTWSQLVDFFIRNNVTKVWRMAKGERIV